MAARRVRSENKVAGAEVNEAGQFDLEIGPAIPVHIARDHGDVTVCTREVMLPENERSRQEEEVRRVTQERKA